MAALAVVLGLIDSIFPTACRAISVRFRREGIRAAAYLQDIRRVSTAGKQDWQQDEWAHRYIVAYSGLG